MERLGKKRLRWGCWKPAKMERYLRNREAWGQPLGKPGSRARWVSSIVMAAEAYVVASVVGALTILVVTGDFETIAAGLLAPLFLLPSIFLFVAFAQATPTRRWKHYGYSLPVAGILAYLLVFLAMDLRGIISEGRGLPAIMLFTFGVPALVAYLLLIRVDRRIAG